MFNSCGINLLKSGATANFKTFSRKFTLRRALLYVPAHDSTQVEKALTLDVDCLVLDCGDGIPLDKKPQARKAIKKLLDKGKPVKNKKCDFAVRVNLASSELLDDDLSVVLSAKHLPDTLVLGKAENEHALGRFSDSLKPLINSDEKVQLMITIESATSLINAVRICKIAKEMSLNSKFIPAGLIFGSDGFCTSIGAARTETSFELSYVRQKIVAVAKTFGLQAIDMIHRNQDLEVFKKYANEGAQMGFTGKQIINPDQIEITQKTFSPDEKEIEWASQVLNAHKEYREKGKGAVVYQGEVISLPLIKYAKYLMNLADTINVNIAK